jgi:flagellar basal-body rod protein FlgB
MPQSTSIVDLLRAGIQAEGARQKTIASNIANIETPGYRRQDVQFERLLAEALESGGNVDLEALDPVAHEPRNTPLKANGNDVGMETEIGNLVKNSLRHTAFVRLLRKKFSQMEAALNTRG